MIDWLKVMVWGVVVLGVVIVILGWFVKEAQRFLDFLDKRENGECEEDEEHYLYLEPIDEEAIKTGDRIRKLRESMKFSEEDFAEAIIVCANKIREENSIRMFGFKFNDKSWNAVMFDEFEEVKINEQQRKNNGKIMKGIEEGRSFFAYINKRVLIDCIFVAMKTTKDELKAKNVDEKDKK